MEPNPSVLRNVTDPSISFTNCFTLQSPRPWSMNFFPLDLNTIELFTQFFLCFLRYSPTGVLDGDRKMIVMFR